MIYLKTKEELQKMRSAADAVKEVLLSLKENVKEGVSTWELNKIAEGIVDKRPYTAAFKGYSKYPASVCFALDGYYGDSAITVPVGRVSPLTKKLLDVTEASLFKGIESATSRNFMRDISRSIQNYVEGHGFSVVKSFVGHGIGRNLHEDPQVPNYVGKSKTEIKLRSGMVLAIEPMVNVGTDEVKILSDDWTAVTADGKLSAHFEHTVAITDDGTEVLTRLN